VENIWWAGILSSHHHVEFYLKTYRSSSATKELSFDTNSNCLIPISLQSDDNDVNLWYFKLRLFGLTEFIVRNIKGLQHLVGKRD